MHAFVTAHFFVVHDVIVGGVLVATFDDRLFVDVIINKEKAPR